MTIPTGVIARDESFFNREKERKNLWKQLKKEHILLCGPRRLGKSSLLARLVEVEARDQGYLAALIDIGGCASASAALDKIDSKFPAEELGQKLKKVLGWLKAANPAINSDKSPISLDLNDPQAPPWAYRADALSRRLADKPLLICLDEFPVLLKKMLQKDQAEAEAFCLWLRDFRLQATACRLILSGSIGLNSLLIRHRLTTHFEDLHPYRLEAFSPRAALKLLTVQAKAEGWLMPAKVAGDICARIGWLSPYHLNLLLLESIRAAEDREEEMPSDRKMLLYEDVESGYSRLLNERSRYSHWHQRLADNLDEPELGLAKEILGLLAKKPEGLSLEQLRRRLPGPPRGAGRNTLAGHLGAVLEFLEEEGYVSSGATIAFLSFPLRDYWRRNHA